LPASKRRSRRTRTAVPSANAANHYARGATSRRRNRCSTSAKDRYSNPRGQLRKLLGGG
jgi:hypothetical protein